MRRRRRNLSGRLFNALSNNQYYWVNDIGILLHNDEKVYMTGGH